MGDDVPPDDEQLSAYMQKLRSDGMQVDYDPVEVGPPCQAGHAGGGVTSVRQALIDSHFA